MNNKELCETAIKAGLSKFGKIRYDNEYPYNVGYWHGSHWTFDCLGFVHTLVNGFSGDQSKLGGGAVMDSFVLLTTEESTLYDYCHDQSTNFKYKICGELLYMKGHVGLYVGDIKPFDDGRIFNVAECCLNSFGGGGMLTYVADNGIRYNHKNGSTAGYWTHHAKFNRINYITDTADVVIPNSDLLPADILDIANDVFIGVYGYDPERRESLIHLYGEKVHRQVQDIMNILYR